MSKRYDYIVVGGGSAGCVAASRLSQNGMKSILLIEAGPASDVHNPVSPLRDASRLVLEGYNWDYEANVRSEDSFADLIHSPAHPQNNAQPSRKHKGRKPFNYRVGKVLGGSSAVNGAIALRGFPSDFDKWASMGCPKWSWEQVLPWFKHLESDVDRVNDDSHGSQGPMCLRRPPDGEIHPLDMAFAHACEQLGVPYVDDLNVGEHPAVGPVPANVINGAERVDVYRSYLESVLNRKNLHIITDALVAQIFFNGTVASGVKVIQAGKESVYQAKQIVLCAGAIGSAALLQRSGVGDPEHLNALGIPIVAEVPAVGRNLTDHASVVLWALPKAGVCTTGLPWRQIAARISSGYDEKVDVQIGLLNNVASDTVPGFKDRVAYPMLVGASVMLMRPQAQGRVFISAADPTILPHIDLPLTRSSADIARLIGGVRKVWEVLRHPEVAGFLDGIQFWSHSMIYNDEIMNSAITNLVNPGWHASGTLRMGHVSDPDSATQEDGQVHGITGVTVADASLFPTIPSMPTNLTTIMTAERIVSFLMERETFLMERETTGERRANGHE
ncbi:GMC family oxidoreductase [Xenorhabdus hominickii]|uniref:Glucose-methanol-choline oxidoreductase n=1 Tax=Xenorhabdus hominickii TaxID=351679 RepID=A0A2G0QD41_XENHO|nr:GMC family oxidoreductase N-terminal domain-containing protein [Xenorhabdus hominickii]AOM41234.1 glucose-methanol-choline oxidoreductase [Xenorhabdus hominickii]PHM55514.1 glucose-methanol-choline oxidoreductase [Xenorhabdus hominickii]PHM57121.1 glucose-methanol-choline oxidoreductase [Xenorhabdus hominickii]